MANLADRNNNPGNIRYNPRIDWQGQGDPNAGFATLATPEHGVRAMSKNLYTYNERDGLNTVGGIISKWAPPSENDTQAYINKVSNDLGVGQNDDLGVLQDDPELTAKLVKSMAHHEGATVGPAGKYTDEVIKQGVKGANGGEMVHAKQETDFNANAYNNMVGNPHIETETASAKVVKKQTNKSKLLTSNWMSAVDSPTYKWTLYIVNNEVWENPNILHTGDSAAIAANKVKIVAEQGVTTEFALDNFMMMSTVTPGQAHGHTTPGVVQFDIFETLGFTFLDRTLRAGIELGMPSNLHSQNYILKLEFIGRDPVTSASTKFEGIFFYPVKLNQIRSSTGPEGTRYNIIAYSMIKHAQTYGVTTSELTVDNIKTVGDFATNLVEAYNKSYSNFVEVEQGFVDADELPLQEIEIIWHESTRNAGIKYPALHPRAGQRTNLKHFNIKLAAWAATANANEGSGENVQLDNVDLRTASIKGETALGAAIAEKIQDNCPAWADWVLEARELGITPGIVVEPDVSYTRLTDTKFQAEQTRKNKGKTLAEMQKTDGQQGGQPVHIKFTVKVYLNFTTADPSNNVKVYNNPTHQLTKMKMLPIEKIYTYLYSGLNTEVLNYNIDIESLFTVVTTPADGIYSKNNYTTENYSSSVRRNTTKTKAPKTKYLEDMPHNQSVHNFNNLVQTTIKVADTKSGGETYKSNIEKASIASNMAKREFDAFGFEMEIKGDPYWMGNMQVSIGGKLEIPDYGTQDAMIAFIQYNPNVNDLLEHQRKGPVDVISSGVYKLTSISSRFQEGRFTQTLTGYKDVTTNTSIIMQELIQMTGE